MKVSTVPVGWAEGEQVSPGRVGAPVLAAVKLIMIIQPGRHC